VCNSRRTVAKMRILLSTQGLTSANWAEPKVDLIAYLDFLQRDTLYWLDGITGKVGIKNDLLFYHI